MMSIARKWIGQNAICAINVAGEVVVLKKMSMPDQIRITAATTLAINQPTRRPEMIIASPALATAARAKAAAPQISAAGMFTGKRRAATSPTMPPAMRPAKARKRSCLMAGLCRVVPRSIGAWSSWATTGASSTRGPPRPPERHPMARPTAKARPSQPGAQVAKSTASALVKRLSGKRPEASTKKIPEKSAARYTR